MPTQNCQLLETIPDHASALAEAGFLEDFYFVEYKRAMLDYVGNTIEHNDGLVWEFR